MGAVTGLQWNSAGTALLSCGEDGTVKEWSPKLSQRAKLASMGKTVGGLLVSIELGRVELSESAELS